MHARLFLALTGLWVGTVACAAPEEVERNFWPVSVRYRENAEQAENWTGAGPFLFNRQLADSDGNTARGFRPFWVELNNRQGDLRAGYFLYPIFSYSRDESTSRWSIFELIRRAERRSDAPAAKSLFEQDKKFEVFPFWFSRETGDGELNYRALFPFAGTVKNKLGFERLSWTLFPLYVENELQGAVTTSTPWPFIRVTRGAARGWGVWPLYHFVERPGVSRQEAYLWPFGYNNTRQPNPDDPPGTPARREIGVLPFYARSSGPGYLSEDYLWPFFGHTHRTQPKIYSEQRYLWPFFVQGRGDDRFVNRWAPFYSHSIVKGYDKEWFAWPVIRRARWEEEGVERTRSQFLYFLYWNEEQRVAARANSPTARLTHLWPLVSDWDNGAGRRQWQLFSPLEVFFPGNEKVRLAWSPFFAIARHDQRAPGNTRTSLFWNLVTWENRATEERSELHVGPLLSVARNAGEKRVAVGNGLFGFQKSADRGWRVFWLDFSSKHATVPSAPAP